MWAAVRSSSSCSIMSVPRAAAPDHRPAGSAAPLISCWAIQLAALKAIPTLDFTTQSGCSPINSLTGKGGLIHQPTRSGWRWIQVIHSGWPAGLLASRRPGPSQTSESLCAAGVPVGRRDRRESRAALAASVRSGTARAAFRRARSRVMRAARLVPPRLMTAPVPSADNSVAVSPRPASCSQPRMVQHSE